MFSCASTRNILAATPAWSCMPRPTIDTLAMASSPSTCSAPVSETACLAISGRISSSTGSWSSQVAARTERSRSFARRRKNWGSRRDSTWDWRCLAALRGCANYWPICVMAARSRFWGFRRDHAISIQMHSARSSGTATFQVNCAFLEASRSCVPALRTISVCTPVRHEPRARVTVITGRLKFFLA